MTDNEANDPGAAFPVSEDVSALPKADRTCWKIAVIDDDPTVHHAARLVLEDCTLEGRRVTLLSARSAKEGRHLLEGHPDVAVVLLGPIMETDEAGLDLADHIRRVVANDLVQIILRTGQSEHAPERDVIVSHDVKDHRAKTEFAATEFIKSVTAALRAHNRLKRIAEMRRGLEIIVEATTRLCEQSDVERLAEGILTQVAGLLEADCTAILLSREQRDRCLPFTVLGGSGRYSGFAGRRLEDALHPALLDVVQRASRERRTEFFDDRTILCICGETGSEIVVILDALKRLVETDISLLSFVCGRLAVSIDNSTLYQQVENDNRTLEGHVVERTEELAVVNRRLLEQWHEARRAKRIQGEMLGTVAHDVKNILTIMKLRNEKVIRLANTVETPTRGDLGMQAVEIRDAIVRMSGMIDMLVEAASVDARTVTIRPHPGCLKALLMEVVEANRVLAERKQQRFVLGRADEARTTFDPDRMREAVDNVVNNAIKYSPRGSKIVLVVGVDRDHALIEVTDQGPGLTPEDSERMFGLFARLSAQPTDGEPSTGLGLFSAKRILEVHDGTLSATSPGPGLGSTFAIRLPRPKQMVA